MSNFTSQLYYNTYKIGNGSSPVLEEQDIGSKSYKIFVVFCHGIGGSGIGTTEFRLTNCNTNGAIY